MHLTTFSVAIKVVVSIKLNLLQFKIYQVFNRYVRLNISAVFLRIIFLPLSRRLQKVLFYHNAVWYHFSKTAMGSSCIIIHRHF